MSSRLAGRSQAPAALLPPKPSESGGQDFSLPSQAWLWARNGFPRWLFYQAFPWMPPGFLHLRSIWETDYLFRLLAMYCTLVSALGMRRGCRKVERSWRQDPLHFPRSKSASSPHASRTCLIFQQVLAGWALEFCTGIECKGGKRTGLTPGPPG